MGRGVEGDSVCVCVCVCDDVCVCVGEGRGRGERGNEMRAISVVQRGAAWCSVVQRGAAWCSVVHRGAAWCSVVHKLTSQGAMGGGEATLVYWSGWSQRTCHTNGLPRRIWFGRPMTLYGLLNVESLIFVSRLCENKKRILLHRVARGVV